MALGNSKICRRKEQRYPSNSHAKTAALYYENTRFDGELINESDSGMAILVSAETEFQIGRKVRIVYQRDTFAGEISWIEPESEGTTIGVALRR